jgi:hypothetical protein
MTADVPAFDPNGPAIDGAAVKHKKDACVAILAAHKELTLDYLTKKCEIDKKVCNDRAELELRVTEASIEEIRASQLLALELQLTQQLAQIEQGSAEQLFQIESYTAQAKVECQRQKSDQENSTKLSQNTYIQFKLGNETTCQ